MTSNRLWLWALSAGLLVGMGLVAPGLVPAAAAQGTVVAGVEMGPFVMPGNHFSADLPRRWTNWADAREAARTKAYGVYLTGPEPQKGAPVLISVRYFAPGNTIFTNEEDYVRRNAFPSRILPPLKGEKFGPIRKIAVAGREARAFNRETLEYYPPHSINTQEIPVKDLIVVAPAGGGFFVLHYHAPTSVFDRYAPVFDRVLESFKPGH
jgi:hypothetical protein